MKDQDHTLLHKKIFWERQFKMIDIISINWNLEETYPLRNVKILHPKPDYFDVDINTIITVDAARIQYIVLQIFAMVQAYPHIGK